MCMFVSLRNIFKVRVEGLKETRKILNIYQTQFITMADKIVLYHTSVSSSVEVKKEQQRIEMVLTGKHIEFEKIDISLVEGAKEKMREICGDEKALPPQLCKGDTYLGNYQQFEEAIEDEMLDEFLKL